jgi:hypothetical protein
LVDKVVCLDAAANDLGCDSVGGEQLVDRFGIVTSLGVSPSGI